MFLLLYETTKTHPVGDLVNVPPLDHGSSWAVHASLDGSSPLLFWEPVEGPDQGDFVRPCNPIDQQTAVGLPRTASAFDRDQGTSLDAVCEPTGFWPLAGPSLPSAISWEIAVGSRRM